MFRFTIRDVLWLTVVVGLAAGWWRDHVLDREYREGVEKLAGEATRRFGLEQLRADKAEAILKKMQADKN